MTSWKAVQVFVVYSHKPKIYSLYVFVNSIENIKNQEVGLLLWSTVQPLLTHG